LLHKLGKSMEKADGLTRIKHLDDRNNNQNVVLLPHNVFSIQLRLLELDLSGLDSELYERTRNKTSSHVESWVQEALASKSLSTRKATMASSSTRIRFTSLMMPSCIKISCAQDTILQPLAILDVTTFYVM
jgi:hypothetical protein